MRLPKELTTVTPFSKYLAMILFVIFPFLGFFLGTYYQSKIDSPYLHIETITLKHFSASSIPASQITPIINIANWKTFTQVVPIDKTPYYNDPAFTITMQYPSDWTLKEFHMHSNRVIDNPAEINTAVISGKEGQIKMEWGPMGFGGGGCNFTPFQIKNMTVKLCDIIRNDTEGWYYLSPNNPNQPAEVDANANSPYLINSPVVKTMLSTLAFD